MSRKASDKLRELMERERYAEGEEVTRAEAEAAEQEFGPHHLKFADALCMLSDVCYFNDKHEEAIAIADQALSIVEKALEEGHPDAVSSLQEMGDLYILLSDYDKSEALYKRVLELRKESPGADDLVNAETWARLASVYILAGEYAKAEVTERRALAITEKALGPDHPEVAAYLDRLAQTLADKKGNVDEAKALYERELAIRENALGQSHPDVARVRKALARVARGKETSKAQLGAKRTRATKRKR